MEEKTAIDITDHDDILKRASVPCISSVFILGHGARQVTIHSQQVRALKLLWALDRKSWLAGKRVVIIGGGIAGVTAASAALVLGANVTLLERGEELLHLQRGCHTRYLHPHIYEWPASTARRASADLPIVNWTVGKASDVATQILADFAESDRAWALLTAELWGGRRLSKKSRTPAMCRLIPRAPQSLGAGNGAGSGLTQSFSQSASASRKP